MIDYMGRMTLDDRISTLERVIENTHMLGADEGMIQLVEWLKELKAYKEADCISRQAVKDMLTKEWTKYMPTELDINLSFVLEKISELPSVAPKVKSEVEK